MLCYDGFLAIGLLLLSLVHSVLHIDRLLQDPSAISLAVVLDVDCALKSACSLVEMVLIVYLSREVNQLLLHQIWSICWLWRQSSWRFDLWFLLKRSVIGSICNEAVAFWFYFACGIIYWLVELGDSGLLADLALGLLELLFLQLFCQQLASGILVQLFGLNLLWIRRPLFLWLVERSNGCLACLLDLTSSFTRKPSFRRLLCLIFSWRLQFRLQLRLQLPNLLFQIQHLSLPLST